MDTIICVRGILNISKLLQILLKQNVNIIFNETNNILLSSRHFIRFHCYSVSVASSRRAHDTKSIVIQASSLIEFCSSNGFKKKSPIKIFNLAMGEGE